MTIEKINEKLATCDSILWTWSTNSDGLYPVKIRVTYNRKNKYYSVDREGEKVFLSKEKWKQVSGKNPRGENKQLADAIGLRLNEAKKAVTQTTANGKLFTFDRFERNYINQTVNGGFITWFESYLKTLEQEGRIGSYVAYKNALSAFKAFRNDKDIAPSEITVHLLKNFEAHLRKPKTIIHPKTENKRIQKAGSTTVSMYMRAMKVVYNHIADTYPELKIDYPFAIKQNDRGRYQIPASSGEHKGEALSTETLKAFIDTKTEPETPEHIAKLYFLFSFYAQGMNMKDIANLRYSNIKGNDSIRYVRQKTQRTAGNSKQVIIEVPLNDELKKIIVELSTTVKTQDNFVFPVLSNSMTAVDQDKAVRQFIKITNKWLKSLCEKNEIQEFTTYSARHSYASIQKFSGESVELIRELLGHSDIKTTENYLKRFDIDTKKKANQNIMKVLKSA